MDSHNYSITRHYFLRVYGLEDYRVTCLSVPAPGGGPLLASPDDSALGDWAGMVPTGANSFRVVVADICGKGHGVQRYHKHLRLELRRGNGTPATEWLTRLHAQWPGNRFASLAVLDVDTQQHRWSSVVAGHPDLIVRSPRSKARFLPAPRYGLVGIEDCFDSRTPVTGFIWRQFLAGDSCVMITDGVLDAGASRGEGFGLARVLQAVDELSTGPEMAKGIVTRVFEHLAGRPNEDDLTVVVVSRDACPVVLQAA